MDGLHVGLLHIADAGTVKRPPCLLTVVTDWDGEEDVVCHGLRLQAYSDALRQRPACLSDATPVARRASLEIGYVRGRGARARDSNEAHPQGVRARAGRAGVAGTVLRVGPLGSEPPPHQPLAFSGTRPKD